MSSPRQRRTALAAFGAIAAAALGSGAYIVRDLPAALASPAHATPMLALTGGTHGDGYARAQFGREWADVDHNGCDTRNDVLGRWLHEPVLASDGCTVVSGRLVDPYTGQSVLYRRGASPQPVQIDHVYDLHAAWHNGASEWTPEQREAFANDPSNLLPTTLNSTKGDDTPAQLLARRESGTSKWQPDPEGECRYAQTYALTAAEYLLNAPETDDIATARMLRKCG